MGELYRLDFASGKAYIGITIKTAAHRFIGHRRAARSSGKGVVYKAWRKYGEPVLTVLAVVCDRDLYETERRAIKVFGTRYPHGYNFTDGGDIPPSLAPEVAEKISFALKGRSLPHELRRRLSKIVTGRKHTEEAKRNMSKAQKGKYVSPSAKKKMAAAKLGGKLPLDVRVKMSTAQRMRRLSEGCTPQRWRYP